MVEEFIHGLPLAQLTEVEGRSGWVESKEKIIE